MAAAVLSAALRDASARGDATHVARLLTNANCHVNGVDENGYSSLQRAAADGYVDVVRILLQYKAEVNGQDHMHGNTPLHEASWKGYSRCVVLLASHKANLHIRNYGGFAPLHLACQNGHNQTCREILLAGCDPDLQNNYGDSSLHTSARYGHAGVTRILISAECKVSIQNKNGDTALHIAAAMGRRKLTRILLEAGCDKSLKNKQNETARDIATRKELNEILDILNIPAVKPKKDSKKREKSREKSKECGLDAPDAAERVHKKQIKKGVVTPSPTMNNKDKKKTKNVHFEPAQKWSPYGCHYYPDPKSFPKPKLDSLPTEPLKKGEQYYLDLGGNICKGPVGVGYTCYCAPFFRHMEDKLDRDKQELKLHIDKAHERLDQKVSDLEMKTQGQISQLTKCVAAERVLCRERHLHLEQWLTRGMIFRQSERIKRLNFSPKGSVDIPPMKRTRSLEVLDPSRSWNKVNDIIRNFNQKVGQFESGGNELKSAMRKTSKSAEILLDVHDSPDRNTFRNKSKESSLSFEVLDSITKTSGKSVEALNYSTDNSNYQVNSGRSSSQNVTAEIHIKPNNIFVSQSSLNKSSDKIAAQSPLRTSGKSTPSVLSRSDHRNSDSDFDIRNQRSLILNGTSTCNAPIWKSEVLQRTADNARRRAIFESDLARKLKASKDHNRTRLDEILHDGYVKFPKQPSRNLDKNDDDESTIRQLSEVMVSEEDLGKRKSVQELAAKIESVQENNSFSDITRLTDPKPAPRNPRSRSLSPVSSNSEHIQSHMQNPQLNTLHVSKSPEALDGIKQKKKTNKLSTSAIAKVSQKNPTSKRFSLQNLIPFPTRKAFHVPQRPNGNNSESSDEDDVPIRTSLEPGLMRNSNLIKSLPLPNYENTSAKAAPTIKQVAQPQVTHGLPSNLLTIPKDAYFHEIPNRPNFNDPRIFQKSNHQHNGYPAEEINYFGNVPPNGQPVNLENSGIHHSRSRNPLYGSTGLFDAMMQDHMSREVERMPHLYGYQDRSPEIHATNMGSNVARNNGSALAHMTGMPYVPHGTQANFGSRGAGTMPSQAEASNLHERMQSLAINTQLTELQSQLDRDSHNDSGYSTKVYSSQGPSPSLSGNLDTIDLGINPKLPPLPPNKHNIKHNIHSQFSTSSLV